MHLETIHFSCLHIHPLPCNLPRITFQRRRNKENLIIEAVVWRSSHSEPFSPYIFMCKCSRQSHWSGLRPLVSNTLSILDPHWDSSWISCCCWVTWKSAGPVPSCALADQMFPWFLRGTCGLPSYPFIKREGSLVLPKLHLLPLFISDAAISPSF